MISRFFPIKTGVRLGMAAVLAAGFVSCSAPGGSSSKTLDPDIFSLSEQSLRSRFPQSQRIGVVELSARRIQTRSFNNSADEKEYVGTGGAYLVKYLDTPVYAYGEEIVVTPDAATIRGPGAMAKQADGRILVGDTVDSTIIIDGTQVRAQGPHRIETVASLKVAHSAPSPVETAFVQPDADAGANKKEDKTLVAPVETKRVSAPKPSPELAPKPRVTANRSKTSPVAAAPKPKPVAPATKPKPPASAPQVDRKKLLNLMREPTE